ncbi:MAG TPA: homoserine kinase [Myxococcaceae bacterium]|nr:homoserine kinase [Myxococcaceae bacterium]
MAIYTPFEGEALAQVARVFGLGAVRSAEGVPQGSINTNYRLDCEAGRFFLRHTTVRSGGDLEFEASLVEFLTAAGFPAPHLVRTGKGEPFLEIKGGRASVFRFLPGEELSRSELTPEHAEQVGRELGKLHRLTQSFGGARDNPYSRRTVRGWLGELGKAGDEDLRAFSRAYLRHLEPLDFEQLLPRGVIHADLFMDNVKWVGDRIAALFDFEMACRDVYVLDLAIALNAWCFNHSYDPGLARAIVRGYQLERQLSGAEREALYDCALFGAIRYTASRIRDFHLSGLPPERLQRKDFRTYLARAMALSQMGRPAFAELVGLASDA